MPRLTPRQQQIATRIANGESAKRIATNLGLSVHTVNAHVRDLADKLPGKGPPRNRIVRFVLLNSADSAPG